MYRAIQTLPLIGAVIASSLLVGCSGEGVTPSVQENVAIELGFEGRTTRGDIAIKNLSSQVAGREATARLRPADMTAQGQLVDLLLGRAQYAGTYSDFDRAVEVVEDALIRSNNSDEARIIQARVESALHNFRPAREILADLNQAGLTAARLDWTIRLAVNEDLESVRDERRVRAEAYPSYKTLSDWAAVESALGNYDAADGLYVRALRAYGDVSPLPVAWVQFQRGVMWAEAADRPDRALPLYREAVARLPNYVVANVHLAELEAEGGQREVAIERLRRIVSTTEDPEPAGLLGELLLDSNPAEAAGFIEQARGRYNDLLARHPAAFADHGSEFFSGPGNEPQRALELALANLERRPTERAYTVAIEVAHSAGEANLACELAQRSGTGSASVVLKKLVQSILDDC